MDDDEHDQLISTRSSRAVYDETVEDDPALTALLDDDEDESFYLRMLSDDLSHVLPYGRDLDNGFTVTVQADDAQVEDLIRQALPSLYGPARTLRDGVRTFVEDAVRTLLFGPATYEIDYLCPADNGDQPVAFRIERVEPRTLSERGGKAIQYVPAALSALTTPDGLHYLPLESENLVHIDIDPEMRRLVSSVATVLRAAAAEQFVSVDMLTNAGAAGASFSVEEHRSATQRLLLTATREIGWTGRNLFTDEMLEPYVLWRELRFRRFQLRFRHAALAGLQATIVKAGQQLGFKAELTYSGLISLGDIEQAESDLRTGARSLSAIYQSV
ncbi:MAG: hypothetical protein LBE05_01405 [Microbacterium sp.]|nr:hypothetical protein [Microbacterium sp.]